MADEDDSKYKKRAYWERSLNSLRSRFEECYRFRSAEGKVGHSHPLRPVLSAEYYRVLNRLTTEHNMLLDEIMELVGEDKGTNS